MKRIIYAALATSLVFGLTDCAAEKVSSSKKKGTTSVWKASKKGHSIFLGGTVHLLRKKDYPLPEAFEKAYTLSDMLVFETDTKALADPKLGMQIMANGTYKDNKTLKSVLSDSVYTKLKDACQEQNIPLGMMERMKPSLVLTTLSAMQLKKEGLGQDGVDIFFANKAENDKKEIQHLESVDSQIDRITKMGEGNEDEFVKYSLQDMVGMKDKMDELISTWRLGEEMTDEIKQMKTDYPDMYKSLLVERNNNWMPQILSYLENGTKAFVLVGSLHLYGPDGILHLLEKQGYKIEQL